MLRRRRFYFPDCFTIKLISYKDYLRSWLNVLARFGKPLLAVVKGRFISDVIHQEYTRNTTERSRKQERQISPASHNGSGQTGALEIYVSLARLQRINGQTVAVLFMGQKLTCIPKRSLDCLIGSLQAEPLYLPMIIANGDSGRSRFTLCEVPKNFVMNQCPRHTSLVQNDRQFVLPTPLSPIDMRSKE